jgi:hypothetical protein
VSSDGKGGTVHLSMVVVFMKLSLTPGYGFFGLQDAIFPMEGSEHYR